MKAPVFFMLMLLAVATVRAASPSDAPYITSQSAKLEKRVTDDVAAGKLAKDDGDKFTSRIAHVRSVVETEEKLTNSMRQNLRNELARIDKDITEKEQPAKGGDFGSPSASP